MKKLINNRAEINEIKMKDTANQWNSWFSKNDKLSQAKNKQENKWNKEINSMHFNYVILNITLNWKNLNNRISFYVHTIH